MRKSLVLLLVMAVVLSFFTVLPAAGAPPNPAPTLVVDQAAYQDVSPALRDIAPKAPGAATREHPLRMPGSPTGAGSADPVRQSTIQPAVSATAGLNIAGVGNGDYGFTPNAAPPDTNGKVGATQYVQWVNESFAVFNKSTGALVYGPAAGNTLWAGMGNGCDTNNDGDPIVQWDNTAQRWILTQFSVSTTPYLQCVAVSTTADATGSYYRYAFSYPNFPDYPKMGVWTDGWYISFNMFKGGRTFVGPTICAYNRSAMLTGGTGSQQCFNLSTSYNSLLPADLDGTIAPPAGSPEFVLSKGSNALNFWRFHVDWSNSANTTLTGPTAVSVASFTTACGGKACVPQPGTSQQLDSLGDRLMYRLAYRHFSDGHESMVVNHSVSVTGSSTGYTGIRWYELRNATGATMASATPVLYQQGTFAPDSSYRWMGSIAQDKLGNMAVGYSVSSGSIYPSIRYTGRVPTDPLGTLESEATLYNGGGSQLPTLNRWGDYSSMSIDPSDDCSFWYTTEYLKTSGTFNWSTRIASFKMPGC